MLGISSQKLFLAERYERTEHTECTSTLRYTHLSVPVTLSTISILRLSIPRYIIPLRHLILRELPITTRDRYINKILSSCCHFSDTHVTFDFHVEAGTRKIPRHHPPKKMGAGPYLPGLSNEPTLAHVTYVHKFHPAYQPNPTVGTQSTQHSSLSSVHGCSGMVSEIQLF